MLERMFAKSELRLFISFLFGLVQKLWQAFSLYIHVSKREIILRNTERTQKEW